MPLIHRSEYTAPYYLFSRHLETILPALFRRVGNVVYNRERIYTPDNDFLDLDWSAEGNKSLAIISHGLEGDSHRSYVKGMVKALNNNSWDALAWNYRGCSGEMNRLCKFYHSGETTDLNFVINHAMKKFDYDTIVLIGFSIGGNITLKYLGESFNKITPTIKAAITFSVPCHLESAANHLGENFNKVYLWRFINSLKTKIKAKAEMLPDELDITGIDEISNFFEFDERYTAPINGFKGAKEYWQSSSCIYYLKDIGIPTLLVNAKNDPFLSQECFPIKEAEKNPNLYLEIPETGGHVGFFEWNSDGIYWSEKRALEFIMNHT